MGGSLPGSYGATHWASVSHSSLDWHASGPANVVAAGASVAEVPVPDVPSMLGGTGSGRHALAPARAVRSAATKAGRAGRTSKAGAG